MNQHTPKTTGTTPPKDGGKSGTQKQEQIGEGSYEGTRDYQKRMDDYLENADVAADAQAARPANDAEAAQLKEAEKEGLSHSKAKGK
ncbi:MAG: hypothetical protein H7238_06025 [Polaromonas sp.]|nr:hypothetical protein [Polaromonas sp.]